MLKIDFNNDGSTADDLTRQRRVGVTLPTPLPAGLIPVNTLEQLDAIRYDLNADGRADNTSNNTAYAAAFPRVVYAAGRYTGYKLAKDLDFNDDASYSYPNANKSTWTRGTGWAPIGTNSNRFTGTFDGGGHTISNLFVNRSRGYIGLFGSLQGATIRNIGIVNPKVTGTRWRPGRAAVWGFNQRLLCLRRDC